jgi:hypothetical protein
MCSEIVQEDSMDSAIELLRTLVVQVVVYIRDSSQVTDQTSNRHSGRTAIFQRTASTSPPADVLVRPPIKARSPEASAMSTDRMIFPVSVRFTFGMSPSAKLSSVLRVCVAVPAYSQADGSDIFGSMLLQDGRLRVYTVNVFLVATNGARVVSLPVSTFRFCLIVARRLTLSSKIS